LSQSPPSPHLSYYKKSLPAPATLRDAIRLVARMGGYVGRKKDPEPGHQLMWEGLYQLLLMAEGFALRSFDDEEDAEDAG
jgi:Transposase Tn5 dimerisation domain